MNTFSGAWGIDTRSTSSTPNILTFDIQVAVWSGSFLAVQRLQRCYLSLVDWPTAAEDAYRD
jgi:hypothetical protein